MVLPRTSLKYEAHLKLEDLGITTELLKETQKNSNNNILSNRDSINGIYRIILHRLQKQSNSIERDDSYGKTVNEDLWTSWPHSTSVSGEPNEQIKSLETLDCVAYERKTTKPKQTVNNTDQHRLRNKNAQQSTRVCMIV